ncbi:unnamed protein product [Periconia digitata]|uniref:Uncharacterized protein n=1 Tax=Periconia digitata TaxID=1303443 RepID=A0A9W4XZE1_9PLEO|nr:unnamed protein product [Periconia digitata]
MCVEEMILMNIIDCITGEGRPKNSVKYFFYSVPCLIAPSHSFGRMVTRSRHIV